MSGARVEIRVDDAQVKGAFARLFEFTDDLTPVMRSIGAQLRQHVDERFEDARGPGRLPWTPSRRAREQGGQTLTDTARLRQSMTFRADKASVEVGTNVAYAATHQFGATIRAKTAKGLVFPIGRGGWRRVKQVTIAARPFLGIDQQDRDAIDAIVTDHLARLSGAGPASAPPA